MTSVEICAGMGGQALGLELAGFDHVALVEYEAIACETLRTNRPGWNVLHGDVRQFDGAPYRGADLLAGGVPCPPFSMAGRQLGADDERDLFPEALRLVDEIEPLAVMLENVRGLASTRFDSYRHQILERLRFLGYTPFWRLVTSSDFGVAQLRPRFVLVALKNEIAPFFSWPTSNAGSVSVGEALFDLMSANGWKGAEEWRDIASRIGPTLVGGSKKHGGADLGPTRARMAWRALGVDGRSLAEDAPSSDAPADLVPKLTVRMTARLQGFPDGWEISGRKTASYRQVGNAFPPPVAKAIASEIRAAIQGHEASLAVRASDDLALVG